jgi:hypothetical protein
MQNKKFILNQDLSNYEFLSFSLKVVISTKSFKQVCVTSIILPAFYSTIYLVFIKPQIPSKIFLLLLLPILFTVAVILVTFINSKQRGHLQARYIIDEFGIDCTRGNIGGKKAWKDFLGWKETNKYFLIFLQKNVPHVIQKRMFNSSKEIDDFRQFIKSKLVEE